MKDSQYMESKIFFFHLGKKLWTFHLFFENTNTSQTSQEQKMLCLEGPDGVFLLRINCPRELVPIGHRIHHDHIHSWFSSQLWLAYQPLIVRDYIIFYNQKRPYFSPDLSYAGEKKPWEKMSPARFFAVESGRWLSLGFPEATVTLQTCMVRDTTQVLPSQLLMTTRNPGCKLTSWGKGSWNLSLFTRFLIYTSRGGCERDFFQQ